MGSYRMQSVEPLVLERCLPARTTADFPRLTNVVRAMVATAVAPSAERVAVARWQINLGRMERVRQVVRKHLRSPTLAPTTLCRLVGMSRSNLYRLFEDTGGVARYIQKQRLLEAHAILFDPATIKPISAIAEDLCFADASSFSRVFKREFGQSPNGVRLAALAALAPSATPRSCIQSDRADFGEPIHEFWSTRRSSRATTDPAD
jgi:AraC-like DNA-binding protein